ncbi:MAG: hypothetical protein OEV66_01865 [Spirochaetia bacterium]|nr:hypothetical protein [Spirochaetia bacterium]
MSETRHIISDITVDYDGTWYSGKDKIENAQILLLFKKNLFADVNGLFIYNEFSSQSEKAYIKAKGPVLRVLKIMENKFILDSNEKVDIAQKELAMDTQNRLYIVIDRLKAWAVFSRQAIIDMGDQLSRKEGVYYWNNRPIRLIQEIPWFFG